MAIDTRDRRASVLGWGLLALVALPLPDGAVAQADRQQTAAVYAGIEAGVSDNVGLATFTAVAYESGDVTFSAG